MGKGSKDSPENNDKQTTTSNKFFYIILFLVIAVFLYFSVNFFTNKPKESDEYSDSEQRISVLSKTEKNKILLEASELLKKTNNDDELVLKQLELSLNNIFSEQIDGTVDVEEPCVFFGDPETININRIEGFVEEINSVCMQTEIVNKYGQLKMGLISEKEMADVVKAVWNKYFYSEEQILAKTSEPFSTFGNSIDGNNSLFLVGLTQEVNQIANIEIDAKKLKGVVKIKNITDFMVEQAGFGVGMLSVGFVGSTMIGSKIADRIILKIVNKIATKLLARIASRAVLAGVTLGVGIVLDAALSIAMDKYTKNQLNESITVKLKAMQRGIIYGGNENKGIYSIAKDSLEDFKIERKNILNVSFSDI